MCTNKTFDLFNNCSSILCLLSNVSGKLSVTDVEINEQCPLNTTIDILRHKHDHYVIVPTTPLTFQCNCSIYLGNIFSMRAFMHYPCNYKWLMCLFDIIKKATSNAWFTWICLKAIVEYYDYVCHFALFRYIVLFTCKFKKLQLVMTTFSLEILNPNTYRPVNSLMSLDSSNYYAHTIRVLWSACTHNKLHEIEYFDPLLFHQQPFLV